MKIPFGYELAVTPTVRILHVEQLSELIGRKPSSIRTYCSNPEYQHLVPPPFKLMGSRRLCWKEAEVLSWIDGGSITYGLGPLPRRGRPTKREQLARAAAREAKTCSSFGNDAATDTMQMPPDIASSDAGKPSVSLCASTFGECRP